MKIRFTNDPKAISAESLDGFFVGWPDHPDTETHLRILRNSYAVWLALEGDRCVGFINALSDDVFYAYIPLLEALPEFQKRGIGRELVERMLETLDAMYAIDVVCDPAVEDFYRSLDFQKYGSMIKRNYKHQSGSPG